MRDLRNPIQGGRINELRKITRGLFPPEVIFIKFNGSFLGGGGVGVGLLIRLFSKNFKSSLAFKDLSCQHFYEPFQRLSNSPPLNEII